MKRGIKAPAGRVTMRTIADEAGVTLTTVSRILNHHGDNYAEPTKQKIFRIAERLKYRPNALVRGMQTGKTRTAGVMIPAGKVFYSQLLAGIQEELAENDTIMLLSWNHRTLNQADETLERQIIHQMVDRRVEGILLRPSSEEFDRPYFEEIQERKIPLILVDRQLSRLETDFVGTDDHRGGRQAAEYLVSCGHRRMLFVGNSHLVSSSRLREAGFREVLSESPHASCDSIALAEDSFADQVRQQLQQADPPTAIFCYNDPTARAVAAIVRQAGLSIPHDLSLLGFGNLPAADGSLALTSFDQHPHQLGVAAAKVYFERISSGYPNGYHRVLIPADLVERGSVRAIG